MSSIIQQIDNLAVLDTSTEQVADVESAVIKHLDDHFTSWEDLVELATGTGNDGMLKLDVEQEKWRHELESAETELADVTSRLPNILQTTRATLRTVLDSAQSLSLERYALADEISSLVQDVFGDDASIEEDSGKQQTTADDKLLVRLEKLQERLEMLDIARKWAALLEKVMDLSQQALSPSHSPSTSTTSSHPALSGLPIFRQLHALVGQMQQSLPPSVSLVGIARTVRDETWQGIKSALASRLLKSLDGIGWPKKIDYPSVPIENRKEFEIAFREMLSLQVDAEKMNLDVSPSTPNAPTGIYPIEVMIHPVALRFKFHFEGTRGTNRLDKPEWAFSHILDLIFEHRHFAEDYLQPLLDRTGFAEVDALSELINQLIPLPLSLLQRRFPHLLDHPALLAHTVYQTVIFDDSIRADDFDITRTWSAVRRRRRGSVDELEWKGLAEQVLSTSDWYERWLAGERKFAEEQYNQIISSGESWTIADSETMFEQSEDTPKSELRPTLGAQQVQALLEQVTDRYSSLPSVRFKLPFLARIQLPLLEMYHDRLLGSLDAFETLSSSFMRAVPGALAGHAGHNGLSAEQGQMTSGTAGLQRLCKAWVSAAWLQEVLSRWDDEPTYIELLAQLKADPSSMRQAQSLPGIRVDGQAIFGDICKRFEALSARAEEMMIRHISLEVERDLKSHLTRRWDTPEDSSADALEWQPGTALVTAMSALSSQLGLLARTLPPKDLSKIYRLTVAHLSNHILQRAVFAGWSKYTATGGLELALEVDAWCEVCIIGLDGHVRKPEAPWRELRDASVILSLPQEPSGDGRPSFSQAMALAFGGDLDRLRERLGIVALEDQKIQAIMRRRIECWR